MIRDIKRFEGFEYDILIIGGGINGAAIANLAALNGLKTALIEKGDFAGGTSSKSTKLLHGGLRYLENFEFDLVHEALKERLIQLKSAPHLAKPLGFIIPVYETDQRPLWMMRLGVFLYDLLSGRYIVDKHKKLSVTDILQLAPGINKEKLKGGVLYYDVQMDDARICLENVLNADKNGAHVANYISADTLIKENGKAVGVRAIDVLSGNECVIRAKKIVCTVGPWTNDFMKKEKGLLTQRVRTTKGVHIVYRGQFAPHAILGTIKKDNRIFFIIPWRGNSLIGTTDTDYTGRPDDVDVKDEDIDYLLKESQRFFPEREFTRDNIITTFAGLRPLVHKEGSPSKLSRKHVIEQSYSGIVYVMGGKYTTYRKIAEDALKFVAKKKLIDTEKHYPLYGSDMVEEKSEDVARAYGVAVDIVESLKSTYGSRYKDVLDLVRSDEKLKIRVNTARPVIKAQIAYAIKTEMACTPEDIVHRRLSLVYDDNRTQAYLSDIKQIFTQYSIKYK